MATPAEQMPNDDLSHMDLGQLKLALQLAKADEDRAKAARLNVEAAIVSMFGAEQALKDEGTTTLGGVSVSTGYTRKWDQKALADMATRIRPEFFPFRSELKEDRRYSRALEEANPELWGEISQALTLTPKKPTVTLKEK